MKAIIASDIHGSYKYTKKLEELFKSEKPDLIILLGDILSRYRLDEEDNYPINEVANILNKYSNKIVAVKGNCDSVMDGYLLNFGLEDEYKIIKLDDNEFYISHGHLYNKYKYLFLDNNCLFGHTHVYNLKGKHLNPGSVGLPRMNQEHTCLLYENKVFKLIDLDDFTILEEKEY